MEEYHKIQTLFKRDEKTKKLIEGEFTNKTVGVVGENLEELVEDNIDNLIDKIKKKYVKEMRKCPKNVSFYSNFLIDFEPLILWNPISAQSCMNKSF